MASFIGLLPAQVIAVTVGSTLRSMQDIFERKEISTTTYVFITMQVNMQVPYRFFNVSLLILYLQLVFGLSVMIWITAKARKELLKALNEANAKYGQTNNFNVV